MIKNGHPNRYSYSGFSFSFDVRRTFSLPNRTFGKKVAIFGAEISSSMHIDNKKKKGELFASH